MQRVFSHIRQVNLWQSAESVSGRGSELAATEAIRASLADLFQELGITSILDAPCGDFNWMRHLLPSDIAYLGVDVVADCIERNQQAYGTDLIRFMVADITRTHFPKTDLIICRDCLVHLPLRDGSLALRQFKFSGAKYLLTTTSPSTVVNQDAPLGSWRALNLCLPPFNFPAPLKLLSDPSDDTGTNSDKSMGLWNLQDLAMPLVAGWSSPQIILTTLVRKYFNPSWRL